jgi:hypothetical protein
MRYIPGCAHPVENGGEVFAVDDRVAIGKGVEIKKENEDV